MKTNQTRLRLWWLLLLLLAWLPSARAYYDPSPQRWINRDPIGEAGGQNLYGFVVNDPVDDEDPFGFTNQPGDFGWGWYTSPKPIGFGSPPPVSYFPIGSGSMGPLPVLPSGYDPHAPFLSAGSPNAVPYKPPALSNPVVRDALRGWGGAHWENSPFGTDMLMMQYKDIAWGVAGGIVGEELGQAFRCLRAANTGLNAENLKLSQTVANHLTDVVKSGANKGALARPYLNSTLTAREIMSARPPLPDPGGVPGGLRWDVPGQFQSTSGTWQLVVDPNTGTILHYNFVKP